MISILRTITPLFERRQRVGQRQAACLFLNAASIGEQEACYEIDELLSALSLQGASRNRLVHIKGTSGR